MGVLPVASGAALGGEVVLVPPSVFGFGRQRLEVGRQIGDQVARAPRGSSQRSGPNDAKRSSPSAGRVDRPASILTWKRSPKIQALLAGWICPHWKCCVPDEHRPRRSGCPLGHRLGAGSAQPLRVRRNHKARSYERKRQRPRLVEVGGVAGWSISGGISGRPYPRRMGAAVGRPHGLLPRG